MKMVLRHDLYTREFVQPDLRTIEHIVPSRLLTNRTQQCDSSNLFVVHKRINRFRSDFRFGGSIDEIVSNRKEWEHVSYNVFRNRKKRIFFPMHGRKIVADVCLDMLRRYPDLYDYQDQIMVEDDVKTWFSERLDDSDKFLLFLKSTFKNK